MSQVPFFAAVQILIFPQKKGMVTNMVTRVFVEKRKGFDVLGFTPHQKFVFKEEFARYANEKGILLIFTRLV